MPVEGVTSKQDGKPERPALQRVGKGWVPSEPVPCKRSHGVRTGQGLRTPFSGFHLPVGSI